MKFALTEDHVMLRDALASMLKKACPPEVVWAAWENETGRSGLWSQLAEVGLLGLTVSEENGGLGMGAVEAVLMLEQCGRVCLPEPVVEAFALAPLLSPSEQGRLAAGELMVSTGLYADAADVVYRWNHDALERIQGARFEAIQSVDKSRRVFALNASEATPVDEQGAFDRGALGTAAVLLGLGKRMLEMSVEYATVRHQFGKPIGSFQAVQHHLADARIALEFAEPMILRAAWSMDSLHIAHAKARANEAAQLSARKALQVHGAIGYSYECDLHLWMKRAWALSAEYGTTAQHRAALSDHLLGVS